MVLQHEWLRLDYNPRSNSGRNVTKVVSFMDYARANLEDSGAVSRAVAADAVAGRHPPRIRDPTREGRNGRPLMWGYGNGFKAGRRTLPHQY